MEREKGLPPPLALKQGQTEREAEVEVEGSQRAGDGSGGPENNRIPKTSMFMLIFGVG